MGISLIILGVVVWFFWANSYQKHESGEEFKKAHEHGVGCIPLILAIGLVGLGIFLLVSG